MYISIWQLSFNVSLSAPEPFGICKIGPRHQRSVKSSILHTHEADPCTRDMWGNFASRWCVPHEYNGNRKCFLGAFSGLKSITVSCRTRPPIFSPDLRLFIPTC